MRKISTTLLGMLFAFQVAGQMNCQRQLEISPEISLGKTITLGNQPYRLSGMIGVSAGYAVKGGIVGLITSTSNHILGTVTYSKYSEFSISAYAGKEAYGLAFGARAFQLVAIKLSDERVYAGIKVSITL